MPCSPGMTACKATCKHRDFVRGYQQERERQLSHAEETTLGYKTEFEEAVRDNPLITFKDWLKQTRQPEGDIPMTDPHARSREATAEAWTYYQDQAVKSWVPDYMTARNLPTDTAGYAPPNTASLTKHLRGKGFSDQEIIAAGLGRTMPSGDTVDVFNNRAVLPIHSIDGEVVAFVGRKHPANQDENTPKYINSPTTALFSKTETPFGLDPVQQRALRDGAGLVIVEGPMDALAVRAARPDLVTVAPLGTALTNEQLATLDKIAPLSERRVAVVMDGDAAGQKAAIEARPKLVATGVEIPEMVKMPAGQDPAGIVQEKGKEELASMMTKRKPLSSAEIDASLSHWMGRIKSADCGIEERFNAVREVAPLVGNLPVAEEIHQVQRIAKVVGWDAGEVSDVVHRYAQGANFPQQMDQSWQNTAALTPQPHTVTSSLAKSVSARLRG